MPFFWFCHDAAHFSVMHINRRNMAKIGSSEICREMTPNNETSIVISEMALSIVLAGQFSFRFFLAQMRGKSITHNFPFGFEGRMWDLIVSVPDHCLSFYFTSNGSHFTNVLIAT